MDVFLQGILWALGGAVVTLVSFYFKRKESKLSDDLEFEQGLLSAVEKKNKVADELIALKTEIHAPRIIILKSENGGGIPRATDHVYLSVLDEVPDSNIHSIKHLVQKLPTDVAYNELIIKLVKEGGSTIFVKDMEDGILKTFYQSEGIELSIVRPIVTLKDKFIYCSLAWKTTDVDLGRIEYYINSRINNIRNIYESE